MRFVFLGKPMSGKGTQAKLLAKRLGLTHISTGEILGQEVKNGTALGKKAKQYMEKGLLVPDDVIIAILREQLPEDQFILDGFPRTIAQAQALERIIPIEKVFHILCSDAVIIQRTILRRICKKCGAIFGKDIPSKVTGVCDHCGGQLDRRPDDTKETVKNRLVVFAKETAPLIAFYKKKGLLVEVNGDAPIAHVQRYLKKEIENIK